MKTKGLFLMLIFLLSAALVFAETGEDAILGKWMVPEKDSVIEIYKKDGKFYGKIVWLEEPYDEDGQLSKDVENPDPALQERTILGMEFIYGFIYNKDAWEKGRIYNPRNGKVYYCKLTLTKDGKLKLRGSLDKMGILGQTEIWTRKE